MQSAITLTKLTITIETELVMEEEPSERRNNNIRGKTREVDMTKTTILTTRKIMKSISRGTTINQREKKAIIARGEEVLGKERAIQSKQQSNQVIDSNYLLTMNDAILHFL